MPPIAQARTTAAVLSVLAATAAAASPVLRATPFRPGVMCQSPQALAALTLPDGDSRTHQPNADVALAIAKTGGCIDLTPGTTLIVRNTYRNTSRVTLGDGTEDATIYTVPNIDLRLQRGPPSTQTAPAFESTPPATAPQSPSAAPTGPAPAPADPVQQRAAPADSRAARAEPAPTPPAPTRETEHQADAAPTPADSTEPATAPRPNPHPRLAVVTDFALPGADAHLQLLQDRRITPEVFAAIWRSGEDARLPAEIPAELAADLAAHPLASARLRLSFNDHTQPETRSLGSPLATLAAPDNGQGLFTLRIDMTAKHAGITEEKLAPATHGLIPAQLTGMRPEFQFGSRLPTMRGSRTTRLQPARS